MQILAAAPYVPYEGVPHAGGEYLLRHLEFLARTHTVTLLVLGTAEAQEQARRSPDWLDLVLGPMPRTGRSSMRRVSDALYNRLMLAPPAPTAASLRAIRDAGLVERAHAADLVELHWPEYARFATTLRRAGVRTPISVVEHDADLDAVRHRVREFARGPRRLAGMATAPVHRRWERRGLTDADLVLVFKSADEELLRRAGITTTARVIDPWLDEPTGPDVPRVPRSVVFAGALWRRENADGALWFLDRVWPHVRAALPDAGLTLAGARPPTRLCTVAAAAGGVVVTGEVPDLLPYYRSAELFVAPLFVGGGLKFKIPQAMLTGTPVVATSCAAQGVVDEAPSGSFWAVTDDPHDMAERIIIALRQPAAATAVGHRARAWARERYSFERSMGAVEAAYREMVRLLTR